MSSLAEVIAALTPELRTRLEARFWPKIDKRGPDECWPWLGYFRGGYGKFKINHQSYSAHSVACALSHGLLVGQFGCHRCDNPPCCNPGHIFPGTHAQNRADCVTKNRHAMGDRSGSRTHPERIARGDRSGARLHPESYPRGDEHYSRTRPELLARGERHGSRTHPERLARGVRHGSKLHPESIRRGEYHWSRLHPERRTRGEHHGNAKLTEQQVLEIRVARWGGERLNSIASRFGIDQSLVSLIAKRKAWGWLA